MATGIIRLTIVISAIAYGNAQYIPLPYGGLNIGKTADGSTAVDLGSSINVLGYGPQGSTRWVSGPNGFHTYGGSHILAKGQPYGIGSGLGYQNGQGVNLGTNIATGGRRRRR